MEIVPGMEIVTMPRSDPSFFQLQIFPAPGPCALVSRHRTHCFQTLCGRCWSNHSFNDARLTPYGKRYSPSSFGLSTTTTALDGTGRPATTDAFAAPSRGAGAADGVVVILGCECEAGTGLGDGVLLGPLPGPKIRANVTAAATTVLSKLVFTSLRARS
jgi:hypothetical protein